MKNTLNNFIMKIYSAMGVGLIVSAFVSFLMLYIFPDNTINIINSHSSIIFILGIIEILTVFSFTQTKSYKGSLFLYILFTALNGVTLSFALLFYTKSSVFSAFISTAGLFFVMALFGNVTKKDLSGIARISLMILFGIIIAGIVNIFLGSGLISFITSIISIVLFSIFTAYDNQKIKETYHKIKDNEENYNKAIIELAMNLYLDFINLFLNVLDIFKS